MTFAEILQYLRAKSGLSYGKLSKLSGITKTQLFDLEHGHSSNPTLKTILSIAKAYNLSAARLLLYLNVNKDENNG